MKKKRFSVEQIVGVVKQAEVEVPVREFAFTHGGDWRAFEEAVVREAYFEGHKTNAYNRAKFANNTKLGMIASLLNCSTTVTRIIE